MWHATTTSRVYTTTVIYFVTLNTHFTQSIYETTAYVDYEHAQRHFLGDEMEVDDVVDAENQISDIVDLIQRKLEVGDL